MTDGQSVPVSSAARSATVGSGRIGLSVSGFVAAAFSALISAGFCLNGEAASAAVRSSSVILPSFSASAYWDAACVALIPATRASRAEAVARSSSPCPRKGFTATVAASGKAGGILRAARSADFRISESRPGASRAWVSNMSFSKICFGCRCLEAANGTIEQGVEVKPVGEMNPQTCSRGMVCPEREQCLCKGHDTE